MNKPRMICCEKDTAMKFPLFGNHFVIPDILTLVKIIYASANTCLSLTECNDPLSKNKTKE